MSTTKPGPEDRFKGGHVADDSTVAHIGQGHLPILTSRLDAWNVGEQTHLKFFPTFVTNIHHATIQADRFARCGCVTPIFPGRSLQADLRGLPSLVLQQSFAVPLGRVPQAAHRNVPAT